MVMKRVAFITLAAIVAFAGCNSDEQTESDVLTIKVGYVGHDHQLALYVAALEGQKLEAACGVYLKAVKEKEVYDLVYDGKTLTRLRLIKVGGGSKMPAAMERGDIEIGLGGVAAVTKFADKGLPIRIICPLQTDGDMLVMHKDSPINDWKSFVTSAKSTSKPIKIGYKAPVAVAKLIFERALQAEGIPYEVARRTKDGTKVVLVNMNTEKSPLPMLSTGAIDGFVWNQLAVAVAVHKGVGKVAAHLRDLPPAGKWVDHPCCCVAATQKTLRKHSEIVKAFLKVIIAATELIQQDVPLATELASRWTGYDIEVEKLSVPTITYIAEPTQQRLSGMETWAKMMKDVGVLAGRYAEMDPKDIVADVCDVDLCNAAIRELRAQRRNRPR